MNFSVSHRGCCLPAEVPWERRHGVFQQTLKYYPEQKATMLGLHATIVGIGLFPASFMAGILWNAFGPAVPFMVGGFTIN